ncbi:hypothetical protein [Bacteroides ovatus]|uniref:hypothetical protein n=1 Tax=Bacteroides ovatus TaxID=28116 RepID=UPI0022E0FF9D|nr:hypothetical protein [Bacteroides ovatus]
MKKNRLYIIGVLFAAVNLFSGCSEDDPSYASLVADKQELAINLDETPEEVIQIIQGNGNYKVTSSNEDVVTATINNDQIQVTALKAGEANVTITDWAKMSTSVKVTVDQLVDLALKVSSTMMYPNEDKTIEVYTGNGGYSITVDDASVAKATIDEKGQIQVESLTPGTATFTVKDRRDKTTELIVKVKKKMVIDNSGSIPYLVISEPVTIKILDGNGKYTCTAGGNATYLKSTMSEDGTEVIIEGLKRYRYNNKVTITDQDGEKIEVTITAIDDPYLENPSYRYMLAGSYSYQALSTSKVGEIMHSADFNLSQLLFKSATTSTASGYAVQFTGDLTVGSKTSAVLYKVTRNAVDKSVEYPIEDCRIDKVEDGWYWVSFLEPGFTVRSYFITKE